MAQFSTKTCPRTALKSLRCAISRAELHCILRQWNADAAPAKKQTAGDIWWKRLPGCEEGAPRLPGMACALGRRDSKTYGHYERVCSRKAVWLCRHTARSARAPRTARLRPRRDAEAAGAAGLAAECRVRLGALRNTGGGIRQGNLPPLADAAILSREREFMQREMNCCCEEKYVPVDPDYPAERVAHIIENSEANAIVTAAELSARQAAFDRPAVCLDADRTAIASQSPARLPRNAARARARDLCYIIYTSGSTPAQGRDDPAPQRLASGARGGPPLWRAAQ